MPSLIDCDGITFKELLLYFSQLDLDRVRNRIEDVLVEPECINSHKISYKVLQSKKIAYNLTIDVEKKQLNIIVIISEKRD